jgi:tetratricopeptide (TPR) repeat protein
MLAAGISSDLATKAVAEGFTLSKLRRATSGELAAIFTGDEIAFIRERLQRRKIRSEIVFRLLDESHGRCCICRKFSADMPIIFHHIDEHAKSGNNTYDNLVVLCLNHHAEAHARSELFRSTLPPKILRARKREWIDAVAAHKKGDRPPPGDEPSGAYHPHPGPPALVTRVLGRHVPFDAIHACVLGDFSRIAIRGMAGVGKTVLALQLANKSDHLFPGGVLWSSLADHAGDPKALMLQLGRACGADLPGSATDLDLADILRNWLSDHVRVRGRLLVVVDDARIEWIEEVKLISRAVPAGAVMLLTTREEAVATVINCQVVELDILDTIPAQDLLDLHAGFSTQSFDATSAGEMLTLVGNLPLAIELLGKRIRQIRKKPGFDLSVMAADLRRERLNRLNLPGHPGLMAIFALSYRTLPDFEKRTFRHLGIFASPVFSMINLSRIMQVSSESQEQSLDNLVGSSLLNWGEDAGWYRIHPLLREYSITLLSRKKPEAERARNAHLRHYASLGPRLTSGTQIEIWEENLPEIIHGVKTAGPQNPDIVSKLAHDLWIETNFLRIRGYYREGVVLLQAAAFAAKQLGRPTEVAAHVGNLGTAYNILGDNVKARECYLRAIAIVDSLEDKYDRPAFLANLGLLLRQEGDWKGAVALFEEALETGWELENFEVVLDQINNLGSMYRLREPARAHKHYRLGLQLADMLNDLRTKAAMLSNIGLLYYDAGELEEAERYLLNALEMARSLGDRQSEANRLGHLGNLALKRRNPTDAIALFEAAVAINREIGYKARIADWLSGLGTALWLAGQTENALPIIREALQLSIESGHFEAQSVNHIRLATLLEATGDTALAAQHNLMGETILSRLKEPLSMMMIELE